MEENENSNNQAYCVSLEYFKNMKPFFHLMTEHKCTEYDCPNYGRYIYNIEQVASTLSSGFEHLINEAYMHAYECSLDENGKSMMVSFNTYDYFSLTQKIKIFTEIFDIDKKCESKLYQIKNLRNEVDHAKCKYVIEEKPCNSLGGINKMINDSLVGLSYFLKYLKKENKFAGEGVYICGNYISEKDLSSILDEIIAIVGKCKP